MVNNFTGALKAKLEDEGGIKFIKQAESSRTWWEAVSLDDKSIVASHRLLGECVRLAARELGE